STDSAITVFAAGTFGVFKTDTVYQCFKVDTVTISVNPLPNFSLGNDTAICTGLSYVLDPGGGFEGYMWSDSSSNQTLTVDTNGVYSVTATDGNRCSFSDTIVFGLHPTPNITFQVFLDSVAVPNLF